MKRNRTVSDVTRQYVGSVDDLHIAFTLLEVLVVIAIIAVLISILVPSLAASRARGKAAHCLSRLKDIGTATVTYATGYSGRLPPAAIDWHPTQLKIMEELGVDRCKLPYGYGWAELLYEDMHPDAQVTDKSQYPAQRNFADKYGRVFNCAAGYEQVTHASHYRVYLPGWANEAYGLDERGRLGPGDTGHGRLAFAPHLSRVQPRWVLIGEGSENSDRGDYLGSAVPPHCCYPAVPPTRETPAIELFGVRGDPSSFANEANQPHGNSSDSPDKPNRFAERHYGGGNYLFGDFHVERSETMREELACDWDLNGVYDPRTEEARKVSGCPRPVPQEPAEGP